MIRNKCYKILDDKQVSVKLIDFHHENVTKIHFFIPNIHCSSCISTLENLYKKNEYILDSIVDFPNKKIWITFNNKFLKISDIAKLLNKIGYPPSTDFASIANHQKKNEIFFYRNFIGKLAISFFCFGNVMLLSCPEYVGSYQDPWYYDNRYFFRYFMFFLSLPVFVLFFIEHIKYAFLGLKKHIVNMNLPISVGVIVLFFWSCYEICFDLGSGYFDSLCGFSFFLSISKLFQVHTNSRIFSFKRNYKSFYPILITKIDNYGKEKEILLSSLKEGDIILIRNQEIVPADSLLIKGNASIDNSFITGESYLIKKKVGEHIYAGSKQKGERIYLKLIKDVDHSYLSALWNKSKKNIKKDIYLNSIVNILGKYFIIFVFLISLFTGIYWSIFNTNKIFYTIFSVLIITCPCALSLSSPLIFGMIINFLSKKGFYIKDIFTMEQISYIGTLIFDKTGTLTDPNKYRIHFVGHLNRYEKILVSSLLRNSTHPLSQRLLKELSINTYVSIKNFREIEGKGLECYVENMLIKIGSTKYLNINIDNEQNNKTVVAISINHNLLGYFSFQNYYRKGIKNIFQSLKQYKIVILSGDNNDKEKNHLKSILPKSSKVFFNQNPEDKLNYVKKLQKNGEKVMMFGDGINDCAALNQSNIGVAVSENPTNFFPSCDAFLQSDCLHKIYLFLKISKISTKLVIFNFLISFFYNVCGIIFAVTGNLKPIIASFLMPLSSISVIIFSIVSTWIVSKKLTY
ncbi:heavy metal translocating P-type ATPase [Blattabacterium cuenoti]|uniref:heavy metal translocating P-type ATPase n=1 Tax=Blattabacterium cuenoti TaxID=1653831 RepID=UPI00163BBA79|nr:heavy metal translocating P-type ATPase [Blattabacterium cuenoti]